MPFSPAKKEHLKNGNYSLFERRVKKDGEVLSLVFFLHFKKSPSKSQISGLGFRAPMFYNSVTKTLSSYMTPGPGCSKLGYDNQGLVWNLMSGL